jgi:hypothetical protein
MLYIMHRTQLYIDEPLWTALEARAKRDGTSISELIRAAARKCYVDSPNERLAALEGFIGIRADRPEFDDVDGYIRDLRRGDRRRKMLEE